MRSIRIDRFSPAASGEAGQVSREPCTDLTRVHGQSDFLFPKDKTLKGIEAFST